MTAAELARAFFYTGEKTNEARLTDLLAHVSFYVASEAAADESDSGCAPGRLFFFPIGGELRNVCTLSQKERTPDGWQLGHVTRFSI